MSDKHNNTVQAFYPATVGNVIRCMGIGAAFKLIVQDYPIDLWSLEGARKDFIQSNKTLLVVS